MKELLHPRCPGEPRNPDRILAVAAPDLYAAAEALTSEIEAVAAGEFGQDWADHYGPLFEYVERTKTILQEIRKGQ